MKNRTRRCPLLLLAGFLSSSAVLADPPFRDVLFEVPLNLTELPAIISKVAVDCEVKITYVYPTNQGSHLVRSGTTEVNVVGGTVSQSVQVLVSVPSITRKNPPSSTPATQYTCTFRAFLDEGLGWSSFQLPPAYKSNQPTAVLELTLANVGPTQLTNRPFELSGPIQWPASP